MKATRGVFGGWEAGGWCMQNSVCCVPSVPRTISLDWTMIAVFRVRRAACIVGFVLYEKNVHQPWPLALKFWWANMLVPQL